MRIFYLILISISIFSVSLSAQTSFNLCSGTNSTSAVSGSLYDSGGPSGSYMNSEYCQFLIRPGSACTATITLTFSSFQTESCCDALTIYNGTNSAAPMIGQYKGSTIPSAITTTAGALYIEWYTDGSVTYPGFAAAWTSTVGGSTIPAANFSVSTSSPPLNSNVQFTDLSTNAPFQWYWQFGDGTTSALKNPVKMYTSSGLKTVSLTATNCGGSSTTTQTVLVQGPPNMNVSPSSLSFTSTCSDSLVGAITIGNTGTGGLSYSAAFGGDSVKVLMCTYGCYNSQVSNVLTSINAYFLKYSVSTYTGNTSSGLQSAMSGKNVVIFPMQEFYSDSHYSTYATALNNFVTAGGTVIFCGSSQSVGYYRPFSTGLFTGSFGGTYYGFTFTNVATNDSLVYGLSTTSFTAPYQTNYVNISNSNKVTVGSVSGYDIVCYRPIGSGKAIFLGSDFYTIDNAFSYMIAKAVKLSKPGTATSPNYCSPSPSVVNAGSSQTVAVVIKPGTALTAGTYTYNLTINSNDPSSPTYTIPCYVTVGTTPCSAFSYVTPTGCSGVVNFSNTVANPVTSYQWNFGNGTTSSLANPTCNYTAAGTYTVSLTVCNGTICTTSSKTVSLSAVGGPIGVSCTPTITPGSAGYGILNVNFGSISKSSGLAYPEGYQDNTCTASSSFTVGNTYVLTVTSNYNYNENVSAWIDFNNDGNFSVAEQVLSSNNTLTTHSANVTIPNGSPIYTPLRMRIIDDPYNILNGCYSPYYGQTEDYTVMFIPPNAPPVASFNMNTNSCQGKVNFTDMSGSYPTSWIWNFGDGSASTQQNPIHTYTASGTYTVTLIASNANGSSFSTQMVTVNPLTFNLGITGSFNAGQTLTYTTNITNGISYTWDFGDGNLSGTASTTHSYSSQGTYTVSLTVATSSCVNTMTTSIYVNYAIGIFGPSDPDFKVSVFPNPFSNSTNIKLELKERSTISMEIVNSIGQIVGRIKSDEVLDEGDHLFTTPDLQEGIYFVRLKTNDKIYNYKLISLK